MLARARGVFVGERNPTTGLHDSLFGPSFEEAWGAPPATFLEFAQLPRKLAATAFRRRSIAETYDNNTQTNAGGDMKRSLNAVSYALLGIGTIIATGIFSFLPFVYSIITGPAVVIALLLSGGTAALSALCYCEFGCEYPVVGGGMAYTMLVFGELPAMLCAINLIVDYIFGTAATARNVSAYWTQLFTEGEPKANIFQYKKVPATLETNGKVRLQDGRGIPHHHAPLILILRFPFSFIRLITSRCWYAQRGGAAAGLHRAPPRLPAWRRRQCSYASGRGRCQRVTLPHRLRWD